MAQVFLPGQGGGLWVHRTGAPANFERPTRPFNRIAYSAAHVVADPLAELGYLSSRERRWVDVPELAV